MSDSWGLAAELEKDALWRLFDDGLHDWTRISDLKGKTADPVPVFYWRPKPLQLKAAADVRPSLGGSGDGEAPGPVADADDLVQFPTLDAGLASAPPKRRAGQGTRGRWASQSDTSSGPPTPHAGPAADLVAPTTLAPATGTVIQTALAAADVPQTALAVVPPLAAAAVQAEEASKVGADLARAAVPKAAYTDVRNDEPVITHPVGRPSRLLLGQRVQTAAGSMMSREESLKEEEVRMAVLREKRRVRDRQPPSKRQGPAWPERGFDPIEHLRIENVWLVDHPPGGEPFKICHTFNGPKGCQRAEGRSDGCCVNESKAHIPPRAHACIMCSTWGHGCLDCRTDRRHWPVREVEEKDFLRVMGATEPKTRSQREWDELDRKWFAAERRRAERASSSTQ